MPDHISLWGLRLAICQGFDQYAYIRPVQLAPGRREPAAQRHAGDDRLGRRAREQRGRVRRHRRAQPCGARRGKEIAIQAALFTEEGCERIIRYAFDLARTRKRKKVTSVTKSNAQQYGMVLWDEVFARVAAEYPDVETEQWLVDAMAARFVLRPDTLEVVVASNLFADILSDLGSALAGSLGIAASANLDPERRYPSMFEPVHGSAPDIAGQGIANPIAAIWTRADARPPRPGGLGQPGHGRNWPHDLRRKLTPDLGGTANTTQVGDAVLANL